jgi:UDPglucose 6-dehydrogenase/UDP-N-acetyl-D-galactosamine dehydrogenase
VEPATIKHKTVCVVGLGYVGYPLAEAFSHRIKTIGYDIDTRKIAKIKKMKTKIQVTSDPRMIRHADFVLICVPTPISAAKEPDLSFICSAAKIVGQNMKKGSVVVLESTVVPGATEDVIKPILQSESGLVCGLDFKIGYSPERINPGDDEHVLSRITKIVAGMDDECTERLVSLYSLITHVYRAPDIRTAEATKVIENIQRDVNIALINEISIILHKMGINTNDVLECASTKWNFHPYQPGIVGGHCIPFVPYFLIHKAKEAGYKPDLILSGRKINESIPEYLADLTVNALEASGRTITDATVIFFGLTYKENVPDTRDNPLLKFVESIKKRGARVYGVDPLLSRSEIRRFGLTPFDPKHDAADCIVIATPHNEIRNMDIKQFIRMCRQNPVMVDIKGIYEKNKIVREYFTYISL